MKHFFRKPNSKHETKTQAELFAILQGKNPHIKTLVKQLSLELIDEDTGEYLNTEDLLDIDKYLYPEKFKNQNVKNETMKDNAKKTYTGNKGNQSTNSTTESNKPEKVFPEGATIFTAREGAPEYILGDLVISPETFIEWLNDNSKLAQSSEKYGDQFRFTIKRGQSGKLYLEVNTYKPEKK